MFWVSLGLRAVEFDGLGMGVAGLNTCFLFCLIYLMYLFFITFLWGGGWLGAEMHFDVKVHKLEGFKLLVLSVLAVRTSTCPRFKDELKDLKSENPTAPRANEQLN